MTDKALSSFTVIMQRTPAIKEPGVASLKQDEPLQVINNNYIEIQQKGYSITAKFSNCRSDRLYTEIIGGKHTGSFVLVFGWCYFIDKDLPSLTIKDLKLLLSQHRSDNQPLWLNGNILSGQYCILSFDHISKSLWCTCDTWGQHGFYYGSDSDIIAVSSHAGAIADLLRSKINGAGYISRLRGTSLPPGVTLFAGVNKITCGHSIILDMEHKSARVVKTSDIVMDIISCSFHESVDRAVDVISRAVLRAVSFPRVAVDLTGGNDTRMSAAVLSSQLGRSQSSNLTFKVHQTEAHPDSIIAREIATEFGWTLNRFERGHDISHKSVDLLIQIAAISDGNRYPSSLAGGILNHIAHWSDYDFLLGSAGGEVLRGFLWHQVLPLIGVTKKVNYKNLLYHRFYASPKVNIEEISEATLSLSDHDEYILNYYRSFGEMNLEQRNVYKLDRIHMSKAMSATDFWEFSAYRTRLLPFMTSEVLNVSLSTPWTHRFGRRLVLAIIESLQPSLSKIPHDSGAPMQPLNLSSLLDYIKLSHKQVNRLYSRHFNNRSRDSSPNVPANNSKQWLMWAMDNSHGSTIGNPKHLLDQALKGSTLSQIEKNEIEMLLLVKALKEKYPGINEELDFNNMSIIKTKSEFQL